jgi:hypothetical protein
MTWRKWIWQARLTICYYFFTKMNDEQTCEGVTLSTFPLDQIATLLDEISPFAPQEKGITLAHKVWSKMSFVEGAEEDERS